MGNNQCDITNEEWVKGLKNDPNKFLNDYFGDDPRSISFCLDLYHE